MALPTLRTDEMAGLGAALLLHALLLAVLLMKPDPVMIPPVQSVTVSLAQEVGLEAASPSPVPESRQAMAPTLSDVPEPPVSAEDSPQTPLPTPEPASTRAKTPAPEPKPEKPETSSQNQAQNQTTRRQRASNSSSRRSGASRINDNFLSGSGASTTTEQTRASARIFGAAERAGLRSAISRQLRPHWSGRAPQGLEAEKLVTILTWELNPDGSLKGRPQVRSQQGVTPANKAQAQRHAEIAIRAVQLAAPFDLPDDFYARWKLIRDWRFDRRL